MNAFLKRKKSILFCLVVKSCLTVPCKLRTVISKLIGESESVSAQLSFYTTFSISQELKTEKDSELWKRSACVSSILVIVLGFASAFLTYSLVSCVNCLPWLKTVWESLHHETQEPMYRHTPPALLDDPSAPALLQQPVRWVSNVTQCEHSQIPFGHLLKTVWTFSPKH